MTDRADVVTCFLRHHGEILLLRRRDEASSYPGRWGAVSGYVEHDDPTATARMEIREETAIADAVLVRAGDPFTVYDETLDREWTVHPVLFDVDTRDLQLNEEHIEVEWISPTAILRRETVPRLWTSYDRVAPTTETIETDTEHGSSYLSIRALEVLRDRAGRIAVEGDGQADVTTLAERLLEARPSMAVLRNRVNRVMTGGEDPTTVEEAAIDGIDRAFEVDATAAENAAETIANQHVATLSRSGTVVKALTEANPKSVLIAESRPGREGIIVAEMLSDAGVDVTLCADAALPFLVANRSVDVVLVGADAVLADGRVVNKVGTRALALAAAHEDVPCYVIAATDKFDIDADPRLEAGDPTAVYDGDAAITVSNPTFDVTAADLVDGVITERGRLTDDDLASVIEELRALAEWRD